MKNRISDNIATCTYSLYSPTGLVAWWDFGDDIIHSNKLIDLISNRQIDGNAVIQPNSMLFDGNSVLSGMTPLNKDSESASIEISFRAKESPKQWWTVISNHRINNTYPNWQVNVEDDLRLHTIVDNIPQTVNTGITETEQKYGTFCFTWSNTTVNAYWNGIYHGNIDDKIDDLKKVFYGHDGTFNIGQRDTHIDPQSSIDNFAGAVFSVRFYNRQLSQDEIIHNYTIDKKRFQLT